MKTINLMFKIRGRITNICKSIAIIPYSWLFKGYDIVQFQEPISLPFDKDTDENDTDITYPSGVKVKPDTKTGSSDADY